MSNNSTATYPPLPISPSFTPRKLRDEDEDDEIGGDNPIIIKDSENEGEGEGEGDSFSSISNANTSLGGGDSSFEIVGADENSVIGIGGNVGGGGGGEGIKVPTQPPKLPNIEVPTPIVLPPLPPTPIKSQDEKEERMEMDVESDLEEGELKEGPHSVATQTATITTSTQTSRVATSTPSPTPTPTPASTKKQDAPINFPPSLVRTRAWSGITPRVPPPNLSLSRPSSNTSISLTSSKTKLINSKTFSQLVLNKKAKNSLGELKKDTREAMRELGLRVIPSLHGPNSLPYARCPSGIDAFLFSEDKDEDPFQFLIDTNPRRSHSHHTNTNAQSDTRLSMHPVPLPGNARYSHPSQILTAGGKIPTGRVVSNPEVALAGGGERIRDKRRVVSNPAAIQGGGGAAGGAGGSGQQQDAQAQQLQQQQGPYPLPMNMSMPMPMPMSNYTFGFVSPPPPPPHMLSGGGGGYEMSTGGSDNGSLGMNWYGYPAPDINQQSPYMSPVPVSMPTSYPWMSSAPGTPYLQPHATGGTDSGGTTYYPLYGNTGFDPSYVGFFPVPPPGLGAGNDNGDPNYSGGEDHYAHSSYHTAHSTDFDTEEEEPQQQGGFYFPAIRPPSGVGESRRSSVATISMAGLRRDSVPVLQTSQSQNQVKTLVVQGAGMGGDKNSAVVAQRRASANPIVGQRRMSLTPAVTVSAPRRSSIAPKTRLVKDSDQKESHPTRQPRPPPISSPPPPISPPGKKSLPKHLSNDSIKKEYVPHHSRKKSSFTKVEEEEPIVVPANKALGAVGDKMVVAPPSASGNAEWTSTGSASGKTPKNKRQGYRYMWRGGKGKGKAGGEGGD